MSQRANLLAVPIIQPARPHRRVTNAHPLLTFSSLTPLLSKPQAHISVPHDLAVPPTLPAAPRLRVGHRAHDHHHRLPPAG